MSNNQNENNGWHVKRSLDVGHIITTVVIAVSAVMAFSGQNEKISLNAQRIDYLESQRNEDAERVEKRLDKIEEKIDRLPNSIGEKVDRLIATTTLNNSQP